MDEKSVIFGEGNKNLIFNCSSCIICTCYLITTKTMNYSATYFRANMGEILDETKYNRNFVSIWRRNKREFLIVPVDVIKAKWLENEFQEQEEYKDSWYYKNIETSLNKLWENDDVVYSLNDAQDV